MSRSTRAGLAVGFAAFVLLGLPEGVLGTAWPEIAVSFGQPVSTLAWLLAAYTAGYLVATSAAGHASARLGTPFLLVAAIATMAAGLSLYALAGDWSQILLAAVILGLGAGSLDAGMNAVIALDHGPRTLHLLHACFGVGATLGPLAVTGAVETGISWRSLYALLALLAGALALTLIPLRGVFSPPSHRTAHPQDSGAPVSLPRLWALMACFFLYVGIEVAAAQWSFSVLRVGRDVDRIAGGLAMAGYWAGLTGGRFALAWAGGRIDPARFLAPALVAIVVCAGWFWWNPGGTGILALPLLGAALAGIFPMLVLLTPVWLGAEHTPRAVGYQLAASSAGAIALPAAIGIGIELTGMAAMPPLLFAAAALLLGVHRFTLPRRR